MGQYCGKRFKQGHLYSPEDAEKAYKEHEKRMLEKSKCKQEPIED